MNQKERWEKAQQYEKNWWGKSSGEIKFGFYKDFACQRDKTVNYFNAIGEEIPFEDSKFVLLIIDFDRNYQSTTN